MPKNQTEMMKKLIIMCALMLSMNSVVAFAQQAYTADVFCYQLSKKVTYKGKAPKIGDFLTAILDVDETSEIIGTLNDVWERYQRNEPLPPCHQFMLDEKNGYLRFTFDTRLCDDFNDVDSQSVIDMCYWNCADGKHKIIAENVVSMIDGKYVNGQYSGVQFYIYDNATRRVWSADEEILGAYVEPSIDESKCVTGDDMTVWDETVTVYYLPQQGKDINVVVYHGNKKCETRLVWDGMRFKRQ